MILLRINWNVPILARPNDTRRESPGWQRQRWDLFSRFVLPSLQRQTLTDWQAWLRCDPALRRLTDPMARRLRDPRVRLIYDTPAACAVLAAQDPLRLVVGRLDSDDLLHPGALARWNQETEPGLIQFGHGYALHLPSGRLYEWNHPSAPFIAHVGDGRLVAEALPNFGGNHGKVHLKARRIDDARWYMVLLHGTNLCNRLRESWRRRQLTGRERVTVLREFGVRL